MERFLSKAGFRPAHDLIGILYCFHMQELLDLGETVGTQSRGLSQELINLLPTSKYKFRNLIFRRKAGER